MGISAGPSWPVFATWLAVSPSITRLSLSELRYLRISSADPQLGQAVSWRLGPASGLEIYSPSYGEPRQDPIEPQLADDVFLSVVRSGRRESPQSQNYDAVHDCT